ncbi:MAG TPA: hypothetical protein VHT75_12265 [Acidimicrobiales bacterium]|nr:hypothetical protein [Acidimicrobiales bacterium]
MVLDDLAAILDRLAASDPADLADRDSVIALHCLRNRLDAVTTRAAAFDTTPPAKNPPTIATSTTSPPTPPAAPRLKTTAGPPAATTTAPATNHPHPTPAGSGERPAGIRRGSADTGHCSLG